MSNDTQPEIRFPGFTEDWEQRKFKEIINERREKTKVENEDILLSSAIKGMFLNSELFSHFRGSSNIGYLKIKKNDLILSAQNLHLGNCNVNLRFDSGIVSPAYKVYELVNAEPNYINSWLKRDTTKNFFLKATTEGASVCRKNIEWETLYSQKLYIPKIEEQIKIGNFFKQLDETIALHQRKLDLLKETKKGFLQKMFPKNGAKVPEIRFPGFTEDWEQRKLGELATIVRGASPRPIQDPKWFDTESDVGWLRIADVTEQDGRIYYLEQHISKLGQEKTRVLVEPHLLLSIAATVGKPVVNYVKTGVHDGFLIFLNAIFDREFMFQWLEMFRPKWQKYGQPGSQVNLNSELVRNQEILIPNNEEQQKIGSFFKQLDDTIALHQRELDVLKETKKGFLQKMFV
ncbi:restriction endonuclease subunit S [Enterococcus faecium]|uniref:restriction endonuclease subunit S n=1 Tax=Enterococcus faecium TaxID=1352 RepID=UPI00100EA8B5|nr:restriction endonuclease subunit S [Enterococcus faecium]RXU73406.1 restriction endonuclease subunit S [Enterococcus faecium]